MNDDEDSTNAKFSVDLANLPPYQMGDDAIYDDIAKSTTCLPRLVLFTKGNAIDRVLIKSGHYGIPESATEITDLGPSIDLLVLARRPKAVDMSDSHAIITSFDTESVEFKRMAAKSLEKESNCMYGPSFLVIERNNLQRPLEFFCGTKSSRAEAKNIFPFLALSAEQIKARGLKHEKPHGPLAMTLTSRLVEEGKYSWHVPVANECTTPFTELLADEKIIDEIIKFIAPEADDVRRSRKE
jgi:hypothetical protein